MNQKLFWLIAAIGVTAVMMLPGMVDAATMVHELQPGPAEGKDAWVDSRSRDNRRNRNFGSHHRLVTGHADVSNNNHVYGLIAFDLATLPDEDLLSAKLWLYLGDEGAATATNVRLHPITQAWSESTVKWTNKPATASSPVDQQIVASQFQWYAWDLTNLYRDWKTGDTANHGVALISDNNSNGESHAFWSSDYTTDPALRPKLEVTTLAQAVPVPLTAVMGWAGLTVFVIRRKRRP